jgi:hypothetical protein
MPQVTQNGYLRVCIATPVTDDGPNRPTAATALFRGGQGGYMPLPRWLARANKAALNRVTRKVAPRFPFLVLAAIRICPLTATRAGIVAITERERFTLPPFLRVRYRVHGVGYGSRQA